MFDIFIIVAGIIFLISLGSFIITLKLLFSFRKSGENVTKREFDNSRNKLLLEELRTQQDQDKAVFIEVLDEKLKKMSQKIDSSNEFINQIQTDICSISQKESNLNERNRKIGEIQITINNLLNTIKDDRAILMGWIKEEMNSVVSSTQSLNQNLELLRAFLKSK